MGTRHILSIVAYDSKGRFNIAGHPKETRDGSTLKQMPGRPGSALLMAITARFRTSSRMQTSQRAGTRMMKGQKLGIQPPIKVGHSLQRVSIHPASITVPPTTLRLPSWSRVFSRGMGSQASSTIALPRLFWRSSRTRPDPARTYPSNSSCAPSRSTRSLISSRPHPKVS